MLDKIELLRDIFNVIINSTDMAGVVAEDLYLQGQIHGRTYCADVAKEGINIIESIGKR